MVSLLLFAAMATRMAVRRLPAADPPGKELFIADAERIRDYLSVKSPDSISGKQLNAGRQGYTPREPLNLNAADSADLLPLPGIGPVFAGRIVRFRNLLGGFVRKEQLLEVYGMDHDRAGRILPLIMIDTSLVQRIGINSVTFSGLLRHPYLDYENVRALMQYREVRGSIRSAGEISINGLLPDSVINRIFPYLDFEGRDSVQIR